MEDKEPGYKKLIVWQNAYALRRSVYEMTTIFPKAEMRRISQMRDASRSVKQNIQEGYVKSLPTYINHLRISLGSLSELKGDVEDCFDDGLITKEKFLKVDEIVNKTIYLFRRLIESLERKQIG